jgi:hypothetical protein
MQNTQLVKSVITAPYTKLKVQQHKAVAHCLVQNKLQQKAGALLTLRRLNADLA